MSNMGIMESLMNYAAKNFELRQFPPSIIHNQGGVVGVGSKMELHCKDHGCVETQTGVGINATEFALALGRHLDEMHPDILQIKIGYPQCL